MKGTVYIRSEEGSRTAFGAAKGGSLHQSSKNTIPNLFIVGQHKSGTTALRHFLMQHPEVFFPSKPEQHHFEKDLMIGKILNHRYVGKYLKKKYNLTLQDYLNNYRDVTDQKIAGDKSVSYLYSLTSALEIFEFNPEAKIIAMFREPVAYLYSLHSQNLYNQFESEKDFEKALALEPARKEGKHLNRRSRRVAEVLFYRQRINYTAQLNRFVRLFPKDRIKCIIFEEFREDNQGTVKEVYKFLGIDETFTPQFKAVNPNKRRRFGPLKRLIGVLAMTGMPEKIIPASIYRRLRKSFNGLSTVYQPREKLDPALEHDLKKEFKKEVLRFNDFLHQHGLLAKEKNLLDIWQYREP